MPSYELTLTVRELAPSQMRGVQEHGQVCHGEAPGPDGETVRFHLGFALSGERIYLFREGKLPQELRVNELVAAWLDAARPRRSAAP